jgi:hypothetical protein
VTVPGKGSTISNGDWTVFPFFFLFARAQQVICEGSDQIHSDSKKIKTKRKRMMGWIKNGPKKIELIFCPSTPSRQNQLLSF